MSQHDYNVANQPGANVRADINALAEAIASLNSGVGAPSITFANQLWYDTTNSLLKQRNPANSAWITIASIVGSTWTLDESVLASAVSGSWFGTNARIARIATDGIMEIGSALDFHPDAAGTEDYRLRIARATGANGIATFTQTGTGGINFVPGTGGLSKDGERLGFIPIGMPAYWPTATAPDGWIFGYGQNISRTTYAALFAKYSTTYGVGDGSTTFTMPDYRGRTIAGKDDMGGTSANRLTGLSGGLNGDVLGATGGLESHTLTAAQMPSHTHTGSGNTGNVSADHTHSVSVSRDIRRGANGSETSNPGWDGGDTFISGPLAVAASVGGISANHTHAYSFTSSSAGSDGAHNNVQPTIIQNVIIYTGVF